MIRASIQSKPRGRVMGAKFLALRSEIGVRVHKELEATQERVSAVIAGKYLSRSPSKGQLGRFTGGLQRSVQSSLGEGVRTATVRVKSSAPHALAWEHGRKPGSMPPIQPIERWAQFVFGKKGIGYWIARKIQRQGLWRRPYVQPAKVEVLGRRGRDFAKRVADALTGIGRG